MAEPVEWATATRARRGEATSGDLAVVAALPAGVLVAAVDGLGHGPEAARAARAAGEVARGWTSEDPVALMERCHDALRTSRGASISAAFLSTARSTVTWLGVGNVEGRVMSGTPSVQHPKASLAPIGGLPGHDLPALRTTTLALDRGDVLLLATDGIGASFADALDVSGAPRAIAERVLAAHGDSGDDALVVAVRYLGAPS